MTSFLIKTNSEEMFFTILDEFNSYFTGEKVYKVRIEKKNTLLGNTSFFEEKFMTEKFLKLYQPFIKESK